MMAESGVPERVGRVEQKLDALAASADVRFEQVDKRLEQINKRFDEVRDHFVEMREYIEFAYDRLVKRLERLDHDIVGSEQRLTEGISRVEGKLDRLIDSQSKSRSTTTTTRRLRPSKRRR